MTASVLMIGDMDAPPLDPPPSASTDPDPPEPPLDIGPAPGPGTRRLARRADGRLLGGVAGGLADTLGVDVVLVRLGFVVAAFFGGLGVIAYAVGWLVLPYRASATAADASRGDRKQLLGYALVAVGLSVIGGRVGWSVDGGGAFWPVVLIAGGGAILWLRTRRDVDEPAGASMPPVPAHAPEPAREEAVVEAAPQAPVVDSGPVKPVKPVKAKRPRSYLGALVWCALLVLAGGAWFLDAADLVDVDLGVVFALALALVGAALVVSAWVGRARGLIALGIPLAMIVGVFGLVDVPLEGGIGESTYRPRDVASVDREYRLAIGTLEVDLRDVDFSGTRRRVHAQLGIGDLDVILPEGVRVVVDGHAGTGGVTVFGRSSDECCPTDVRVVRRGTAGAGTVLLDAEVGVGHLDVTQRDVTQRDVTQREESFRATT